MATQLVAAKRTAHSESRQHHSPSDRLRLVIVDPDALARRALRDSLQTGKGFVVAAEAKDGVEAVEMALHYRPQLVLMELALPRIDGIEACRQIVSRAPEVRVVMFTVEQDRDTQMRALRAGANRFVSKNATTSAVVRALRAVARGEPAISRQLSLHLIDALRRTSENGRGMRPVKSILTDREWEVLDLIRAGATTREISDRARSSTCALSRYGRATGTTTSSSSRRDTSVASR